MAKERSKRRALGGGLDALFPTGEKIGTEPATAKKDDSPYQMVRLTKVEPDKTQPRKQFDEASLQELAESIRQTGLLEPILVVPNGTQYTIVAGERRWRACRLAGIKEIPVIIKNFSSQREQMEASLIENIQRENLNPIEEANAYKRLIEEFGLTQEKVAETVQKSRASITNAVRLLKLTDYVQNLVVENKIDMGHARALIPVDAEQQKQIADLIVAKRLSVRETERIVAELGKEKKPVKEKDPALEAIYKDVARRMNESLGMKVAIHSKGKNGGKVEINFTSQDDFEKIMERIMIAAPEEGVQ